MTEEEFYQSMTSRFSCQYFRQDEYPNEELIKEILEESLKITPVFNNDWHHKVDIFGPEYYEDKRKVALQTVEDLQYRKKYDKRNKAEQGIEALELQLREFEDKVQSGVIKEQGFADEVTFNTQVLAPYLLKFTFSHNQFINWEKDDLLAGAKIKSHQSSMAHAYAITAAATHRGVDTSFCGCYILNDFNKNKIWYNDELMIFFVGLGYIDKNCFSSPGSNIYSQKSRPSFENIFKVL